MQLLCLLPLFVCLLFDSAGCGNSGDFLRPNVVPVVQETLSWLPLLRSQCKSFGCNRTQPSHVVPSHPLTSDLAQKTINIFKISPGDIPNSEGGRKMGQQPVNILSSFNLGNGRPIPRRNPHQNLQNRTTFYHPRTTRKSLEHHRAPNLYLG